MKTPVIPTMWPKHPASELNTHLKEIHIQGNSGILPENKTAIRREVDSTFLQFAI